jgi:hypothetical protein
MQRLQPKNKTSHAASSPEKSGTSIQKTSPIQDHQANQVEERRKKFIRKTSALTWTRFREI